ncbi:MAG TPA: hypothetical protein VI685_01245 [Candidatus Angelobacter sp.]
MGEKLLLISWFVGIFYSSIPLFWFFIHPIVRRWRKMQRSPLLENFILLAVSLFVTFPLMIWLERELKRRLGQSFLDYKGRVPLISFHRRLSA